MKQSSSKKGGLTLSKKWNLTGWGFLIPAALMISWLSFYPMIHAFILSLQTGRGVNLKMAEPLISNYIRLFEDDQFLQSLGNTFIYLIIQVPIMLILALIMASLLNKRDLKFKGVFRTAIFLPCATSLVSYAIVFRTLFSNSGLVNIVLTHIGILDAPYPWLTTTWSARMVIIIALVWRWTGYNMVFYLAAIQNLDQSTFEAARIDGANAFQVFKSITVPQLRPIILLTAIMSTNGTLQLFDESFNLTSGGPSGTSMTVSHYLYKVAFQNTPNFGYASAISYAILILVAVLAILQMKVGDRR